MLWRVVSQRFPTHCQLVFPISKERDRVVLMPVHFNCNTLQLQYIADFFDQTGKGFKQHQCFQVAENFQCFQVAEEREPVVLVRVGWDTHMQIEQQARVFLLQKVCFPLLLARREGCRVALTSGGVWLCGGAGRSLV